MLGRARARRPIRFPLIRRASFHEVLLESALLLPALRAVAKALRALVRTVELVRQLVHDGPPSFARGGRRIPLRVLQRYVEIGHALDSVPNGFDRRRDRIAAADPRGTATPSARHDSSECHRIALERTSRIDLWAKRSDHSVFRGVGRTSQAILFRKIAHSWYAAPPVLCSVSCSRKRATWALRPFRAEENPKRSASQPSEKPQREKPGTGFHETPCKRSPPPRARASPLRNFFDR
eukprot:scaffold7359_cov255-Pinguiococcus_pyrenoidosus.AAC.1